MFIAELNHPMFDMFDMSSLRTGIMAGSLCPVELMKRVEEKMFMKVTSVYGLTEASPGMTASRIDDSFDVRCNTVGRDFEFTEVKSDRSGNWRGMSHRRTRRDVQQRV